MFTVNQGKNNHLTFLYFILKLCRYLDERTPQWRATSVFLVDNASIHRSKATIKALEGFGVKIMFLAPYSFKMAAVEMLFGIVKNRDLNPLAVRAYSK